MDGVDEISKKPIQAQELLRIMQVKGDIIDDKVPCKIEEGLYLGSLEAADNKSGLKSLDITHVLTLAYLMTIPHPNDFVCKMVNVEDREDTNLALFFDECFDFIDEAKSKGSVLVHCVVGKSRSATIVVGYLMKKHGMSLSDALELVKSKRPIADPNSGFMIQLQNLEESIKDNTTGHSSKKRKVGSDLAPQLALMDQPLIATRMAAYIRRLENCGELGYHANPANRMLPFTTFNLDVAEIRRCITQVLTRALLLTYYDRSNLRDSEIKAEMALIVPLTVSACMTAIYAKLHAIHHINGRLAARYPIPPRYDTDIELPLPLAVAIQQLGQFQTTSLEQNEILAPTYPEETEYEGRAEENFNIIDYQTFIPVFKDLGIPCKSVDTDIKKGSAWWTYKIRNVLGTTDLVCTIPPTCYTDLDASVRMLFLATQDNVSTCADIISWPNANISDYGSHLREAPPNFNTRAFLALCHGPKEEWSLGHA